MTAATADWAACLDSADAAALHNLRLFPGLQIASMGSQIWLRGSPWNDALALALHKVSGIRQFRVLAGGLLLEMDKRVPENRLPELNWEPLRAWSTVCLPLPSRAADVFSPIALTLARATEIEAANALLTNARAWAGCASEMAAIRLHRLRFAAARDGRVFIEGSPLPSIGGERFLVREGIAVPCGVTWLPPVDAKVIRRWLSLDEGDTAMLKGDGVWEVIKAEQFVAATRNGARLTAEALANE